MQASSARTTSSFLVALLAVCALACGGPPSRQVNGTGTSDGSEEQLELTKEVIDDRINDARVFEVQPENGVGDPIPWSFDEDEPKEIVVVEKKVEGNRAEIILDIKTESSMRARMRRQLAGRIRTDWELKTGWVLRRWEIVNTENISMKYRDLPKPDQQNSNSNILPGR